MAYTGEVLRWNARQGFGFVKCKDFDEELFVHHTAFGGGDLSEGKTIAFDVEEDRGATGKDQGKKKCVNVDGDAIDKSGSQKPRADGRACFNCGQKGHLSKECREDSRRRDNRDERDRRDRDYDRRRDSRDRRDRDYDRRRDSRDRSYDRRRDSRDRDYDRRDRRRDSRDRY